MKQRLFTEILPLYKSKKNHPYAIRIRMRMADRVDAAVLRDAVDTTMKRYPYFCVRLREESGEFVFEDNPSPRNDSRDFIGFEISPEYCAIAEGRLTAITTDNAKEGYVTWAYPSRI